MSSSFTVESGYGETQGRRDTMEDAHVVFDDILAVENIGITSVPGQRVSFYGVYDGHGGVRATFSSPPRLCILAPLLLFPAVLTI